MCLKKNTTRHRYVCLGDSREFKNPPDIKGGRRSASGIQCFGAELGGLRHRKQVQGLEAAVPYYSDPHSLPSPQRPGCLLPPSSRRVYSRTGSKARPRAHSTTTQNKWGRQIISLGAASPFRYSGCRLMVYPKTTWPP